MKPQFLFTNGGMARNEPRGPLQGREASGPTSQGDHLKMMVKHDDIFQV